VARGLDAGPEPAQHARVDGGAIEPHGAEHAPDLEADLVEWGKAIRLTTHGRRTGHPVHAVVGFIEQDDATLLVAAGSTQANWALNLLADPGCEVTLRGATGRWIAEQLDGGERARAVAELILKYGTPSERLGTGPVFRLRPEGGPPPRAAPGSARDVLPAQRGDSAPADGTERP
jgi:deazaflavin-dependent oxidoreductase (nitroreductase family)